MIDRDKRSYAEIYDLYRWVTNHHFWKTNILSPAKLREKWDQLVIQKNNPSSNQGSVEDIINNLKSSDDDDIDPVGGVIING